MIEIGSQKRELLVDTIYEIEEGPSRGLIVLGSSMDGRRELWMANDDAAGYVIEISGMGYEFVRSCLNE